jgi:hypothetical protein
LHLLACHKDESRLGASIILLEYWLESARAHAAAILRRLNPEKKKWGGALFFP